MGKRGFVDSVLEGDIPQVLFQRLRGDAFRIVRPKDALDVRRHCELSGIAVTSPAVMLFEELIHTLTCIGDFGEYEAVLSVALKVL